MVARTVQSIYATHMYPYTRWAGSRFGTRGGRAGERDGSSIARVVMYHPRESCCCWYMSVPLLRAYPSADDVRNEGKSRLVRHESKGENTWRVSARVGGGSAALPGFFAFFKNKSLANRPHKDFLSLFALCQFSAAGKDSERSREGAWRRE